MVMLEAATAANGCLQFLEGSHRLGLLPHEERDGQSSVADDTISRLRARLPLRAIEVPARSAIFFHPNTLHASGPNVTNRSRLSVLYTYVAASNPRVRTAMTRST